MAVLTLCEQLGRGNNMLSAYLIILVISLILFVVMMVFLVQGPPYVASDDDSAEQMVKLLKAYKPNRILDMGSGDGKLVILLAQAGYHVDGVELNPLLVWRSRRAIKRAGVADRASITWGNFWTFDVANYDAVTLYVIKHIMPRLEQKLRSELPAGAHIVSNYFIFPGLKPVKQLSRARVYKLS